MSDFDSAYQVLKILEGGWNDDPADPGGPTNAGISLRFLQSLGDEDGDGYLDGDLDEDGDVDEVDLQQLRELDRMKIYRAQFWGRYKYHLLNEQQIATRVFCLSVHAGPGRAHRILQAAISYHAEIKIDGIIGPQTRGLANRIDPDWIVGEFKHETAQFYRALIKARPEMETFRNGFMNRAYL